jgi:hypothetical protein
LPRKLLRSLGPLLERYATLALLVTLCGCAPQKRQEPPPPITGPQPTNLRADVGHRSAELIWDTNRERLTPIMGFNIYVSREPLLSSGSKSEVTAGLEPVNDVPYPGAVGGEIAVESYTLDSLENGESYYAFVTTVFPGNFESEPTNEIEIVPRPEGSFVLETGLGGERSGFSFKQGRSVPATDLSNDIYLTQIDRNYYVASPARIDNVLRIARFYRLDKTGDLSDIRIRELKAAPSDRLKVNEGEVFVIEDADHSYALVRFDNLHLAAGELTLSYIYQTKPRTLRF